MSDDLPTERFPQPGTGGTEPIEGLDGATRRLPAADANGVTDVPPAAPTEVLYTPTVAPSASTASASTAPPTFNPQNEGNSRAMLYTLIGVGAALLIAVIIVVAMLLNRGDDDPVTLPTTSSSPSATPSATPSPTPSDSPSPEPEPTEPPAPVGPTFDSFTAPPTAGCAEGDTSKPLTFSWSSGNAQTAYIGVATTDAKAAPFESGLPPVDTYTLDYQCSQASQVYTVTLEDADGNLAHQTVTITK